MSSEGRRDTRATSIVLIGARGSGKTTVGAAIADRLACPFDDLDDLALARFDEDRIVTIFETHGEAAWRRAEADAFMKWAETTDVPLRVLALGGGAPMISHIARLLAEMADTGSTWVVYLEAPASVLSDRIVAGEGDRPSLTGDTPAGEMERVLAARHPSYSALATVSIDARRSIRQQVDTVVGWWQAGRISRTA